MLIGVPKEIKSHEYRVGLVPASVYELVKHGHEVIIESGAGLGIDVPNEGYEKVGARIVETAEEVFATAEMIVKVKEPQPNECKMLRPGQLLFTFLHLAPDPVQTQLLVDSGSIAIAYETVTDDFGGLPLLSPMSEVAGRMSIQAGAHCLEKAQGGRGMLLGGVPGVAPAKVVVIGGGVVGTNAVRMAVGMEADVTVLDRSLPRLRELNALYNTSLKTAYSTQHAIDELIAEADLVIGAVLIPGAAAPKLVTKGQLQNMHRGSVIVDVAIDQGGCFETSRATTHAEPTYEVDGVVHYCVANMPGAASRTSAFALNNATLPYVIDLANKGYAKALIEAPHFMNGLNVCQGKITHEAVAKALNYEYLPATEALH